MGNEPVYRPSVRASGTDGTTRRLAIVAASIGAALVVVVGGWSLLSPHPHGIPVIGPPPGPLKVRPVNAGGLQVLGAEPPPAADGGAETLGPPPEQADPQRLADELARARAAANPPATTSPVSPPAPATVRPDASTPGGTAGSVAPGGGAAHEAARSPAAGTAAVTAPAGAPSEVAGPAGRTLPIPAAPATASPVGTAAAVAATGRVSVQLAALTSDEAAHAEWHRLAARSPALFADRAPAISSVDRDGRTWWRLRTGPFDTVASATEFCGRVHAAGISCDVATF